jgi:hypothetical protein
LESAVTKDGKEVNHECVYLGRHDDDNAAQPLKQRPAAPSAALAQTVALSILGGYRGSYRPGIHFSLRMSERDFDVFEMEYAIRNGRCVGPGEYSDEYKDHKFVFRCDIDGVEFDAVFALSIERDLIKSPLMILITGCWKTETGKRRSRY